MIVFTQEKLAELLLQLEKADQEYDALKMEDGRLALINDTLEQVKEELKNYSFTDEKEEIDYFRNGLPELIALQIYYTWKIDWDKIQHLGNMKKINKFKSRFYVRLKKFRREYYRFSEYIRDNRNLFDHYYFLRSSPANWDQNQIPGMIKDPASPPVHSVELARLKAFNRLETGLMKEEKIIFSEPILPWTGKKIDLGELLYVFFDMGSVDSGKFSLTQIADGFEKIFGIRFTNPSKVIQDIINRKKGNKLYMERAAEILRERIENMT